LHKPLTLTLFFIGLLFCSIVNYANAEPVTIQDIPEQLAVQLSLDTWLAGMILSLFIMMLVLLPIIYLTKGKQGTLYVLVGLAILAPLVGLGWFDLWVYIIIILAIAVGMGQKLIDMFSDLRR
jgi:hypothetical protein